MVEEFTTKTFTKMYAALLTCSESPFTLKGAMRTRSLHLKTPPELVQLIRKHGLNFAAASIGISRGALDKILSGKWDSLNRSIVEKICDRFDLEIVDFLELVDLDFWAPFYDSQQCVFIAETISMETSSFANMQYINIYDQLATNEIRSFLSSVYKIDNFSTYTDITNESGVIDIVRNHNCFVIGSPRSNSATEIVVSKYYGAKPFDISEENKKLVPFAFVWPPNDKKGSRSALSEVPRDRINHLGILHKKNATLIVRVDWIPKTDFAATLVRGARDCALVFVIDRPFNTDKFVRTIVLAGYSGIGTLVSAKALIRDFRKLQPVERGRAAGIIEVRYRKTREAEDHREIEKFYWKLLRGERFR